MCFSSGHKPGTGEKNVELDLDFWRLNASKKRVGVESQDEMICSTTYTVEPNRGLGSTD